MHEWIDQFPDFFICRFFARIPRQAAEGSSGYGTGANVGRAILKNDELTLWSAPEDAVNEDEDLSSEHETKLPDDKGYNIYKVSGDKMEWLSFSQLASGVNHSETCTRELK